MKNELYYSTGYAYSEPSSPYTFFKNFKFLFLLTLSILGTIAYFNMEEIQQLINSTKNNNQPVIVTNESYTQPKEQNQSLKKENNFTEEELQHIANEIVKSLQTIKAEKKSLKVETIKTIHYEEEEQAVQTINKTEAVRIKEIKKVETSIIAPPKTIRTTKLSPIEKPSIQSQDEINIIEEETVEKYYLSPNDILETLSIELNNAIELPLEATQEEIPFIEGDITYIEGEIIEEEETGESLY